MSVLDSTFDRDFLAVNAETLRSMFAALAEGVVLHARDGSIVEANVAAEAILGLTRDQMLGRTSMDPAWGAIHEDGTPYPGADHPAMVTLRTGRPLRERVMGIHDGRGEVRWLSVNSQPIFSAGVTGPAAVVATFIDITRQRQLTDELRVARADLQTILDNVPARITSWQVDGLTNRFANRAAELHFGLPPGGGVGKHAREILGEATLGRVMPFIEAAFSGERQSFEQVESQPDGTVRYTQVKYVPLRQQGKIAVLYELATDITDLRESYQKIRDLAQRLESIREQERRSIAQVLHEGIAQELFAMRLGLERMKSMAMRNEVDVALCDKLAASAARSMEEIRRIANDLRPAALAHLSVFVALSEHVDRFGADSGLTINVREIDPFPMLDEGTRLVLFRAAQELLTNVAKHARATKVDVNLKVEAGHLVLEVTDDGIGLAKTDLAKPGSIGLLGLREKLQALGGRLTIRCQPRGGTSVSVQMPFIGSNTADMDL
jgi:PAS domain S-box-containing protein